LKISEAKPGVKKIILKLTAMVRKTRSGLRKIGENVRNYFDKSKCLFTANSCKINIWAAFCTELNTFRRDLTDYS